MSVPIDVAGGAGGVVASTGDMLAIRAALSLAGVALDALRGELDSPTLFWLDDGAARDAVDAARAQVAGGRELVGLLADAVGRAALEYTIAENSVAGFLGSAFDELAGAGRLLGVNPMAGVEQLEEGLPGLVDLVAFATARLRADTGLLAPDGHAVLHDLGDDTRAAATTPPRRLADLVDALALRNEGRHGEVSVSFVTGSDGRRRVIVDIPGTKSWNPLPNHDVASVGTDLRAMTGRTTAYEDGVVAALDAAGVTARDDVMLVGHSEGGIVAVNLARHCAARFGITHVVTAGSPIGELAGRLPPTVRVLALENRTDLVPHADAASNPDRRNVTTVTGDDPHHNPLADHDLDVSYEPIAAAADASDDSSISEFTHSADGFLSGHSMQTHRYWVTRGLA